MLTGSNYISELKAGVRVKGGEVSVGASYNQIAVPVTGTTVGQVFAPWTSRTTTNVNSTLGVTGTNTGLIMTNTTSPISGTVTGFGLSSLGVAGTVTLWATTAGTIATISGSGTAGTWVGSSTAVNAAIVAGDVVMVTPTAGSQVCYITFLSRN